MNDVNGLGTVLLAKTWSRDPMEGSMRTLIPMLTVLLTLGCATTVPPEQMSGVAVVSDRTAVAQCYSLGYVSPRADERWDDGVRRETKERGGDTVYVKVLQSSEAFTCDPQKIAEHKAFDAKAAEVRITNRQDVVAQCRFTKNVTASSERDARSQTVTAGGNVFFVISDTTRTETTKAAGSSTAYTYEVRRLTGESYSCP